MDEIILLNRIQCRCCGDILTSENNDKEIWCSCGEVGISGGFESLIRLVKTTTENIKELSITEGA